MKRVRRNPLSELLVVVGNPGGVVCDPCATGAHAACHSDMAPGACSCWCTRSTQRYSSNPRDVRKLMEANSRAAAKPIDYSQRPAELELPWSRADPRVGAEWWVWHPHGYPDTGKIKKLMRDGSAMVELTYETADRYGSEVVRARSFKIPAYQLFRPAVDGEWVQREGRWNTVRRRNPSRHKWGVGDRVARKWNAKWGSMPPYYRSGVILELAESADNKGKKKPGYLVKWDGDPGIPYTWLQEELQEVRGRRNPPLRPGPMPAPGFAFESTSDQWTAASDAYWHAMNWAQDERVPAHERVVYAERASELALLFPEKSRERDYMWNEARRVLAQLVQDPDELGRRRRRSSLKKAERSQWDRAVDAMASALNRKDPRFDAFVGEWFDPRGYVQKGVPLVNPQRACTDCGQLAQQLIVLDLDEREAICPPCFWAAADAGDPRCCHCSTHADPNCAVHGGPRMNPPQCGRCGGRMRLDSSLGGWERYTCASCGLQGSQVADRGSGWLDLERLRRPPIMDDSPKPPRRRRRKNAPTPPKRTKKRLGARAKEVGTVDLGEVEEHFTPDQIEEAQFRYDMWHGEPADEAVVIRVDDGKPGVTRKLVVAQGVIPKSLYRVDWPNSTKGDAVWEHDYLEGKEPLRVLDPETNLMLELPTNPNAVADDFLREKGPGGDQ